MTELRKALADHSQPSGARSFGARIPARAGIAGRLISSLAVLTALLLLAGAVSASIGSVSIPLSHVAGIALSHFGLRVSDYSRTEQLIVEQLRLPRVAIAVLVGAALGISGATMQSLFRNPMADPGIIGVSSGAATGAVIAISAGLAARSLLMLPFMAFLGALSASVLVYGIAQAAGRFSMTTLLLAGVAVSSFLGATISALILLDPNPDRLRGVLYWLAGSLSGSTWQYVRLCVLPIVIGSGVMLVFARDLNLMVLGDEAARSSGVPVGRVRALLLAAAAVVTGAAVSVSGIVAFVGLVVPHILRLIAGPDHRLLLPASALGGALFMVVADTIARLLVRPAELQVGMVTAFVGAPFFILLLVRNTRNAGIFQA